MAISIRHSSLKNQKPAESGEKRPAETEKPALLPLIALREGVLFPNTETVLVFGRKQSKLALNAAQGTHKYVVIVAQKNSKVEDPEAKDLYEIGTLAKIERSLEHEGEQHALLRGIRRVRIESYQQTDPFPVVIAKHLEEKVKETDEFEAELKHLADLFRKTVQSGKAVEFFNFMQLVGGLRSRDLIDHIASTLDIATKDKQRLLEQLDVNKRVKAVTKHLMREQHILNIEQKINTETKKQIDERMRENVLRERMQAIQRELGELDEEEELDELAERVTKAKMPESIEEKVFKELRRLRQMSPMHSEYSYVLSWIESMLEMPWSKKSRGRTSLKRAAKILDQQHYGLEKVKERVLEHLAVMQLHEKNGDKKTRAKKSSKPTRQAKLPTILCFVGPPGVGKTSIGRSIAEALGREFVKVSLGGVHDEAEIRGHRRTYVGAMPGKIMQGMSQAGTRNPVFMLDEVDKLGSDFRGDPSAALLEALDPEQNFEFTDHYLGEPFDLSEVVFITTANVLHTIPGPLRDRLEIVEYTGYTYEEKFHIAQQYLIKQVIEGAGLKSSQFQITDGALKEIIEFYTREAGVRSLKREIAKLARKAARQIAEKKEKTIKVEKRTVSDFLGPRKHLSTEMELDDQIGLVNGLAWTSTGGEVLHIEAALADGKEGYTITGQLGDVMQESAKAAYTYVRAHAEELGIQPEVFKHNHVHIHAPEGAVPKDGPSAGIALTTVLTSVFAEKKFKKNVAMTGEVTLRGRVLPIGGLKEKLIAAHRAGITHAFIPKQNEKDLVDVPEKVKKDITIQPVEHVSEVLKQALIWK